MKKIIGLAMTVSLIVLGTCVSATTSFVLALSAQFAMTQQKSAGEKEKKNLSANKFMEAQ